MKKGGKLLGTGSYGCVFKPALKCKGSKRKTKRNTLSKVYYRPEGLNEATSEYALNSKIKDIKDYNKWSSIYTDKCIPNSYKDMVSEDPEVTKCEKLDTTKNIVMLQGEYGGIDLDAYMADELITQYSKSDFIGRYHKYLCMFKNILKGLCDMNKHNMCHMDIKYGNMVIQRNVIKLIDFGLSNNSVDNVAEINKRAYGELRHISRFYPPYPPEYIYSCTHSDYKNIMLKELHLQGNKEYRKYHELLKNIHENFYQDVTDFDKYIANLIKRNLDNPLSSGEKKKLYDKVDVYSVGLLFIYLFKYINEYDDFIDDKVVSILNDPRINPFIVLAGKMMRLNYYDRISADQAYKEYCNILDGFKGVKTHKKRKRTNKRH